MCYLNLRILYYYLVKNLNNIDVYVKLQRIYCPDCSSRIRLLNAYVKNQCPYCKKDLKINQICC